MSAPKSAASRFARLAARVVAVGAIALACATGLPAPALADSVTCGDLVLTADGRGLVEDTDYTYVDNVLTIKTTDPVTVSMAGGVEETTADRIVVDPGEKDDDTDNVAHVTIDGVNIDVSATANAAMLVSSGALELELEGASSLRSGKSRAGLQNGENPLTISGAGSLKATGGWDGAGIGGGQRLAGSNITILGGAVGATGGTNGAGIGGGYEGAGSNIKIGGGTITAEGGAYAAGIGGGSRSKGSNICIDGGLLEVAGGDGADVIGSGHYGPSASDVSITSGCFAAGAVDDASPGTVYGIAIELPCELVKNDDSSTKDKYPHRVTRPSDLLVSGVNGSEPVLGKGGDYYYESDAAGTVLRIVGETPMRVHTAGNPVRPAGDGASTTDRIVVDPGEKDGEDRVARVTIDGVSIDVSETMNAAAMLVSSGALELKLAGDSSLKSGFRCAGLQNGENPLTISGAGSLEATGGYFGAGIGGGDLGSGSNITIESGAVTATGGSGGAGIGGGWEGDGSDIAVEGGTVTATGGIYGAGMGGGEFGSGSDITIESGAVTAMGDSGGAGIGGGLDAVGSNISVTGGLIDASSESDDAQPIGNGAYATDEPTVSITGGSFADTADDATTADKVYGVAVATGYDVVANADQETRGEYPVSVVRTASDLVVSPSGGGDELAYGAGGDYYCSPDGVLHIVGETSMTVSMAENLARPAGEGSPATTDRIVVEPGADKTAHVTIDDVKVDVSGTANTAAMSVASGKLELTLEGESSLRSGATCAGLRNGENPLTISGEGSLAATGGAESAGIGGSWGEPGSNITIIGGSVSATGLRAAGIGGGYNGAGSNITISGGVVTAVSTEGGAGIGGGAEGDGSDTTISGGTVTATGGSGGAGIGGGYIGSGVDITITGGMIDATPGSEAQAIGSGSVVYPSTSVSITGGCFAKDAVVNGARDKIYGMALENGYFAADNEDGDTEEAYPYEVIRTDLLVGAAGEGTPAYGKDGGDYYYEKLDGSTVLHIVGTTPMTVSMVAEPAHAGAEDGTTADRIAVEPGEGRKVSVTLGGVKIGLSPATRTAAMEVSSGSLDLVLAGANRLKSGDYCAGLQNGENSLVISGEGTLEAVGGNNGAGIGGGNNGAGTGIVIEGGTVTAEGGNYAAGIGGCSSNGSDITITGGDVTARGGGGGAGIGGGTNGSGSGITISGGTVDARGGRLAAGIGGGDLGAGSDIAISGGLVKVAPGEDGFGSSPEAIGGGRNVIGSDISITGGCFDQGAGLYEGNTIYGIELGQGYFVGSNGDEATFEAYPHAVLRSDLLVSATDDGDAVAYGHKNDYYYTGDSGDQGVKLHIVGETPMTVSMRTAGEGGTAEATADIIIVDLDGTASVTLSDVRIDATGISYSALWVNDGALDLTLAGESSLKSGANNAGLQSDGNPLTISGDGSLEAVGGSGGAGIGGGWGDTGSNITISGGFIDARAEDGAQAVGSGKNGGESTGISITGGCFAKGAGSYGGNTIYGIELGRGYFVGRNGDEETSRTYPYAVLRSDLLVSATDGGKLAYGFNGDYYYSGHSEEQGFTLNIVSQKPMTVSMRPADEGGPSTATADRIEVDSDGTASVTLSDVRIDASKSTWPALRVFDGALNLELSGESSLKSGDVRAGLQNDGNPLAISGAGSLEAVGGESGAGIGGGDRRAGSNITITGGFIDAKAGEGAQAIGNGANVEGEPAITITGGCFADCDAALASASDSSSRGTVYGVAVPDTSKDGDGYAVTENPDDATKGDYPVAVVPAKVQEAELSLADASAKFTYDGDAIEGGAFDAGGDEVSKFEHLAADAGEGAGWEAGLPAGAGDWRVRATVGFAKSGYVADDGLFYFTDHDLTNEVEVSIGRAPLTVTAEDAKVAFTGTPAFSATVSGWAGDEQDGLEEGLLGSLAYKTEDADGNAYSADMPAGSTFTVTPSLKDDAQLDAGMANYALSFEPGTLVVVQSASEVAPDEGSDGQTVTYGESVTVEGTVAATGEAPAQNGLLAAIMSLAVPAEDQVALFDGERQLTDPAPVDGDGRFSLTYDTTTRALSAGAHELEVRYTGTDDRADAMAEVTLTIEPKQLAVAWDNYEGRRHLDGKGDVTYEVTGALEADVATGSVSWAVSGADAASGDAGERTATLALDANEGGFYALGDDAELAYTVDPAKTALAITSFDETVTYGDRLSAEVSLMVGEGAGRQAASAEEVRLSFQDADGATAPELTATTDAEGSARASYDTALKDVPVGAVALTASFAGRGSYGPCASEPVEVAIEPLAVSARVAGSATKVYDGTAAAPADALSIELAGVLEGDDVSATAASYAFDSAGAGEGKDVTASGVALAGADAGWYGLSADTATGTGLGTVERAPLTVRALPQQVVFGAELPGIATPAYGTHFVIEGFVGGETAETPGAWSGAPEVGFDGQYEQGATPAGSVLAGAVTVSAGSLSSANYEFASFSPADLTVLRSATDPGVDEGVETDYVYGDVIVVAGAVAATGDAAEDGVAAMSLEAPAPGQVALFWRDADGNEVQLSGPVTPAADGSYELAYDTAERLVPVGEQTLLVRFAGTGDMADAVQELTVSIGRATLTPRIEGTATKPYDGTTAYLGEDARVTLSGVAGSDDPLGTYALDFEHEGAGAQRLIASEVTLAEGEDAWYELAATTAEVENAGGGIVKAAQQAPSGATGEGEKVAGGDDGSIAGVVPGPGGASWRPAGSGDDAWQPVPEGGTVEGLAPGDYEVRQEGDANHEASDSATVTVPSFSDEHGGITYPDGTAEGEGGLPVLPEGGGTVTWPDGTEAALPGGAAVDPDTGVATTPGGTAAAPGGEGALDVTFPGGAEATVPGGSEVGDGAATAPDGTVVAPGEGGTLDVTFPDGSQATVPGGSEVAGGSVTAPGGTVVAPDGGGGLTVTLPDGTAVSAPSGSSVAAGTVVGPDGARVWPVEDEKPEDEGPEGEEPEGEKPAGADKDDGLARTSDPTALLAPAALAAAGAAVLLARRRVA